MLHRQGLRILALRVLFEALRFAAFKLSTQFTIIKEI